MQSTMALSAGDKLGPFEILSPIGEGGMGEVYKARDTRLDRSVAIKVLPEHIAQRDDLRARFEREARAVASLNHPNICVLYDIGEQDGVSFMVMELLEGETLAARIEKGAIPLDQALKFATQIADALDRAHRAGVTHRDIKPHNIMLTRDGVKVLDFGLAKSTAAKRGPTEATLTNVLTTEGTVLGTPQYMAPEQFEGKEADARSDIWAFGAVLYEMVTGQKAFQGKTYSSLVGAILSADPAPMSVQPFTPAWLERLVKRCLQKDPEDRYLAIHDIVLDLKSPAADSVAPGNPSRWPWAAAACLALALLAVSAIHLRETTPEPQFITTSILPPENTTFNEIAISPDGKLLAFSATTTGKRQLYVRPMHTLAAQPLAGTDGAEYPFWSPDSRSIGFFSDRKLKKIDAAGGPAQALCDVSAQRGGTWSQDGFILYTDSQRGFLRISAQGGKPDLVSSIDRTQGEIVGRWPAFLPDGRSFVHMMLASDPNVSGIYISQLNGGKRTRLVGDVSSPAYAQDRSGAGYLIFVRDGTLMAQPFDPGKSVLAGDAFPVTEKVGLNPLGGASFSISSTGVLVYDSAGGVARQVTWLDRAGTRLSTVGDKRDVTRPALSPDETMVVFRSADGQTSDLWLHELARGVATRFTFDPHADLNPVWSPDSGSIVYSNNREGVYNLYRKNASGAGKEELLLQSPSITYAGDWSAAARAILYYEIDPKTSYDLWALPVHGDRKPIPLLKSEFTERSGVFSPDGKYFAYASDESGRYEVYVQTYPPSGAKWQVSTNGGMVPRWRRDGKEIFFLDPVGALMAAEASPGTSFRSGTAALLFQTGLTSPTERYSVTADGKRFLFALPVDDNTGTVAATVVLNALERARR